MGHPWTQWLRVPWRAELAFYERRFAIARQLEDSGLLRNTRVPDENKIVCLLLDGRTTISFGPASLEVLIAKPSDDATAYLEALRIVWEAIEPTRIARPSIRLHWVEELSGDYDTARQHLVAATLPAPVGANFIDYSAVVDAELENPAAAGQLNFGVVESAELPGRLSGTRSQFGPHGHPTERSPGRTPSVWKAESLPPVAFYCDSFWTLTDSPLQPSLKSVVDTWDTCRASTQRLVDSIVKGLDFPDVPNQSEDP